MTVASREVSRVEAGLLVLLGVDHGDTEADADWVADKVSGLRIFPDGSGKMNLSLLDTHRALLLVSQFTLYADTRKGRRPSWIDAARPEVASPLVDAVVAALRDLGARVETGRFGADMAVELVNDGPVTIMLEV